MFIAPSGYGHRYTGESVFSRLSLPKANPPETAQQPQRVAHGPGHGLRREPEHDSADRPLGIPLPPRASPAEPQPLPGPANLVRDSDRRLRAGEQLELAVPTRCRTKLQPLKGKPIVSIARQ